MPPRLVSLSAVVVSMLATEVGAEVVLKQLENNPFHRPALLKPRQPVQRQIINTQPLPDRIELELTATMVSDSMPMVVVDGELLGIGEKIKGYELIAVTEGGAIFARQGKKYSLTVAEDNDESRSGY